MRGTPHLFADFRGGLNTRDAAYAVAPNQARDLLNVWGTVQGAVRKRDGVQQIATPANVLHSLYGVNVLSPARLIAVNSLAATKHFASVATDGTVTNLGGTPGTARWRFVQARSIDSQGPVYGVNGTEAPVQWTGGAAVGAWTARSGTLPNGKYMAYANGRIWVAGMTAYGTVSDPGSTLVFSNLYDPRDWPTANVVQFDPGDGDRITGLGTVGPYLLVFKRHKVWVVYDLDTGANRPLSRSIGCVSPDSVVETPHGTFFLHETGVYVCNGQSVKLVSDLIDRTIQSIQEGRFEDAVGTYWNHHYLLAVSTAGGDNDKILDYDTRLESWWMHGIAAKGLATLRPSNEEYVYVSDPAVARVGRAFQPNTTTDWGAAFDSYWTSSWLSPGGGGPLVRHRIRQLRADLQGRLSVSLARDFAGAAQFVKEFDFTGTSTTYGGTGDFGGDGTFGDPVEVRQGRAPTLGVGRSFSVKWHSNQTADWELENFALVMQDRRD